jgi:hypothetical protein
MASLRRLLLGVLAGLGIAALIRSWRRKPTLAEPVNSLASELREKLAASRAAEAQTEESAEEPAAEPALETDLDVRRREVHERARGSIDELSESDT